MTTINPALSSPALASLALSASATLTNSINLQLAAGILGQFMNPLNAPRFAFGQFPSMLSVALFGGQAGGNTAPAFGAPAATWTTQVTGRSTANVDLGDGYTLQLDERNSEIFIRNASTGETTRIWGDPHVDVDGKRAFDFWGTSTFTLENGTKITINTEQFGANPREYVASQVVITKGSNAIVVDGISQNTIGDMRVSASNNGYALDAAHRDGFTVHENATGSGWRSEATGQVATQADADITRVGAAFGPGSQVASLGEAMSMVQTVDVMNSFLTLGLLGLVVGAERRFG